VEYYNRVESSKAMAIHTTQSAVKSFQRCKRRYKYQYLEGLEARFSAIPLKLGSWMHSLIPPFYLGEDWGLTHKKLLKAWNNMSLEEREHYGDIPERAFRLMSSYAYQYRSDLDDWEVLHIEEEFEASLGTAGSTISITPDLIIREKATGLVGVVDHKNMKDIPNAEARVSDLQSVVYPEILRASDGFGYEPDFFMFNYIRTKEPTTPHLNLDGTMSRAKIDTDFYTLATFVKENDIPLTRELKERLRSIKAFNPFFHRVRLVKPKALSRRLMEEVNLTSAEIEAWQSLGKTQDVWVRSMQKSCEWDCDFYELCMVELMGGDGSLLRKTKYQGSEYAKRRRKQVGKVSG
jgi:hypothetical protein